MLTCGIESHRRQPLTPRGTAMINHKFAPFVVGVLCVGALLAVPRTAAAQASTFPIAFDRTGAPGSEIVNVIDPITGLQVLDANGNPVFATRPTGAFIDPCTSAYVDVTGTTTLSINVNITGNGSAKVSVGETTKGAGIGRNNAGLVFNPDGTLTTTIPYDGTVTTSLYSFAESQQFNTQFTLNGDPMTITSSTFSDKLFLKGASKVDNWTIKATFTIKINGQGKVTSVNSTFSGDVCKG